MPTAPYALQKFAHGLLGHKWFIWGGIKNDNTFLTSVLCFDLQAQTWTEIPSQNSTSPSPRYGSAVVPSSKFKLLFHLSLGKT